MSIVLITGSCGLVGSESVEFFYKKGFVILGIDNNSRKEFFGETASINWKKNELIKKYKYYRHFNLDIRKYKPLERIFKKYKNKISLIIHAAAQPSHDYAKTKINLDFEINAIGTLNLLDVNQ